MLLSILEHLLWLTAKGKGNDIHGVNYSLVTCDFAVSGVFAALIHDCHTVLLAHPTEVGHGFHHSDVGNKLTPESKMRCKQLLRCWFHRLTACILPTQPSK